MTEQTCQCTLKIEIAAPFGLAMTGERPFGHLRFDIVLAFELWNL